MSSERSPSHSCSDKEKGTTDTSPNGLGPASNASNGRRDNYLTIQQLGRDGGDWEITWKYRPIRTAIIARCLFNATAVEHAIGCSRTPATAPLRLRCHHP